MAKLLYTNLLGEEIPPPEPIPESAIPKAAKVKSTKGKKLYYAVFGAVLIIALAIGGYIIITNYFEKKVGDTEERVQIPFKPPEGMAVPGGQADGGELPEAGKPQKDTTSEKTPPPCKKKVGGLAQIPWLGAYEKIITILPDAGASIYSMTSGPEGWIFLSGKTEDKVTKSILPGLDFEKIDIIKSSKTDNITTFVINAKVPPIDEINFDPEPIPPYERGAIIRKLESIARENGLSDAVAEAVRHEKIADGSRYLISLSAEGRLENVEAFTKAVMNLESMIEIYKISLDGISGKPLTSDNLKFGVIYRVYYLPKIKEPQVEQPLATEL